MQKSIKVGQADLQMAVPADLDGQLLAATGCSRVEVTRLLSGHCLAGFVAKAMVPLLVEPPQRGGLARSIADAGVDKVRRKLLATYRALPKPTKPKKEEAGHDEPPKTD